MLWHQNLTFKWIKSDEYDSTSFRMFLVTPCFEDFKRFARKSDTDGGGSLSSEISSSRVGGQFIGFITIFLQYSSMSLLINTAAFFISSSWFLHFYMLLVPRDFYIFTFFTLAEFITTAEESDVVSSIIIWSP